MAAGGRPGPSGGAGIRTRGPRVAAEPQPQPRPELDGGTRVRDRPGALPGPGPGPGLSPPRLVLLLLLGLGLAGGAQGGCVEVASGTEAVLGSPFRLLCIACKRRSETPAQAEGEWYFRPDGEAQFQKILHYSPETGSWVAPGPFEGVLSWNGSRGTRDLQDLSVRLGAVGRAHAGTYLCRLRRNLTFEGHVHSLARQQSLTLRVVEAERRDLASIVSEALMYVLIVVLTLWLAAEMLYCYRKVAAAAPPPDSASEYLAITSESKENCAGVQVAE